MRFVSTAPLDDYQSILDAAGDEKLADHQANYQFNVPQRGDALELLRFLPDGATKLCFFDPQYHEDLDRLAYGNEGERQGARCRLPRMSTEYIEQCTVEIGRVLKPSGYLAFWMKDYLIGEGRHCRIAELTGLKVVAFVAWDSERLGMGYRVRHRGDSVVVFQKPPILARATWKTMPAIPNRWAERIDLIERKLHPHIKPVGLTKALIEVITEPFDLVVDPAAGSFTVLKAAKALMRKFIGVDLVQEIAS
jgi:site-specific DNA-methyltransferase (adenine-specific)